MTPHGPDPSFEDRLAGWRPAAPDHHQGRDRMLFAAGAASARTRRRDGLWAGALAASLLAAAGSLTLFARERSERQKLAETHVAANRNVHLIPSIVPEAPPALAPSSYLALRDDPLREPSQSAPNRSHGHDPAEPPTPLSPRDAAGLQSL